MPAMSDLLGYLIVGYATGVSLVFLFALFEGLLGDKVVMVGVATLCGLYVVSTAVVGTESAAATVEPLPYWIGLILGVVMTSVTITDQLKSALQRDGTPLVWAVVR